MDSTEFSRLLIELLAHYRERHGGQNPEVVYASADVVPYMQAESDPKRALKRSGSRYSFDGVPVEPKKDQALLFILRP